MLAGLGTARLNFRLDSWCQSASPLVSLHCYLCQAQSSKFNRIKRPDGRNHICLGHWDNLCLWHKANWHKVLLGLLFKSDSPTHSTGTYFFISCTVFPELPVYKQLSRCQSTTLGKTHALPGHEGRGHTTCTKQGSLGELRRTMRWHCLVGLVFVCSGTQALPFPVSRDKGLGLLVGSRLQEGPDSGD